MIRDPVRTLLWVFVVAMFAGNTFAAEQELPVERAMLTLIRNHSEQKRSSLTYNEVLHFVARRKAEDFAKRQYFSHIDPDGFGPNYVATAAGYKLPYGSAPSVNSIESTGVRHQNNLSPESAAQIIFDAWMNSPAHRSHLLAELSGYAEQTYYGLGYAYARVGPFNFSSHYFVFVSAPPDPEARLTPYIRWRFEKMSLPQMSHPDEDPDVDGVPNLLEYVFDSDPSRPSLAPVVQHGYDRRARKVWMNLLGVRPDLDPSVEIVAESSMSLHPGSWSTSEIEQTGFKFALPSADHPFQFLQLKIRRR